MKVLPVTAFKYNGVSNVNAVGYYNKSVALNDRFEKAPTGVVNFGYAPWKLDIGHKNTVQKNKSYQNNDIKFNDKKNYDKEYNAKFIRSLAITSSIISLAALGISILGYKKNIKSVKKVPSFSENNNLGSIQYRKKILQDMNLPEEDYVKIKSIISSQELEEAIDILSKDKENFLPGTKSFHRSREVIFPKNENVKSGKFAANFHLHTEYSDGKITVPELLEQASKYADERVKLGHKTPFYIAITDHDTVEGCKEAVNLILKDPEKYKNLRLVLGIEHTTVVNYADVINGPLDIHMISYGINPFNKELNNFLQKDIITNKNNIVNCLNYANGKFASLLNRLDFKYDYDELTRMSPEIKFRAISANYLIKDYMQFKLIYSATVERNKQLCEFIKTKNINSNFIDPISKIPKKPDYSKGQKYYEYYFEAIKNNIKNQVKPEEYSYIDSQLKQIPEELIKVLNEIEYSVNNPQTKFFIPSINKPTFEEAVKFMKTQENCQMGIAHPGVAFPFTNFKTHDDTKKFYDMLYRDFKEYGKEKALYAEDLYASYYGDMQKLSEELSLISSKYDLKKIGGLDTHIKDIFASKYSSI